MKKTFTFIISAIFLFTLTSCKQTGRMTIENNEWILSTIQSSEQNGGIIAYNPNDNTVIVPENAIMIELSCSAKDNVLTLSDETNSKTYTGEYKELDDNFESTIYEITINETQGTAVASTTEYADGKEIPTLIITFGDYTLNFYSDDYPFIEYNDSKLTNNEEMLVEQVKYWSTWDTKGYYFKNVQIIDSPKICNKYPIVEITFTFELEEITAGGYKLWEVGKTYQKINRCFYQECEISWLHENNDGTTENRTANFHKNEWLQEYDWEKAYWNKNLTFNEMNVNLKKINQQIDEFIKSNNERRRENEK